MSVLNWQGWSFLPEVLFLLTREVSDKGTSGDREPPLPNLILRHRIDDLQTALSEMPQAEFITTHFFADRLYGRQLFIPKGTAYVGKIHRYSHFRFVLGGHLLIVTEDGRYECKAPHMMITPAGTRRVGYAFEDTVVMTVHATELQDPD